MDSISEYNEEQFQMLCLAIADTSSGICLFQCDDAKGQVSVANHVQDSIAKSSVVIDMSNLVADEMPDEIGKVRNLLIGNETVQVVMICNLQLCGEALGDEKYIEKINYMRDQMMAMKKVWVFGMSRYFAIMLSRKARDLYSCILNHFDFKEKEREPFLEFAEIELSGNKKNSLIKFNDLQERINRKGVGDVDIEVLMQAIKEWNNIYECCNRDTNTWVRSIVENADKYMRQLNFQPTDCITYQQVALAWLHLENGEKAVEAAKFIKEKAVKLLPKSGKDMSDIYKLMGYIYLSLKQYGIAEEYCEKAWAYYLEHAEINSWGKVETKHLLAQIKTSRRENEEAIRIFEQLIHDVMDNYGMRYFYLIALWNNMGKVYAQMHQYSKVLECFQNANKLLQYNKEYVGWRYQILRNIAIMYKFLGDVKTAIRYLLEAEGVAERLDSSFESIKRKRSIYTLLEKFFREDSQEELANKYASKLRELVSEQ